MIAQQYEAMLALYGRSSGSIARESISAGTRAGCTARPSSATAFNQEPDAARAKAMLRESIRSLAGQGGA